MNKIRIFIIFFTFLLNGCVSYEELLYFQKEGTERKITPTEIENQVALSIQKSDILSITVHSFDQELAIPFNLSDTRSAGGQNDSPSITYQVDEKGMINFPVLGEIQLGGLKVSDAKKVVEEKLKEHLKEPVIKMRLVNFRVAVLGEVNKPGTFTIVNDRITILEALGLAEDLTPYGNRQNILVIREQNGVREFGEMDIQSTDFLRSPYFYLRQGDVIYVEPRKDKEATVRDQFTEYIPWVSAGLATITTVITIIALFGNK